MSIFIQIAGGVALVLFAVRFLRKGLDRLFGQHLMTWLERMTSHRLKAFVAGVVAGAIAPSSTALSVTLIQLLNASQLGAERVLATLLGANIGITVMVQLLSISATGLAAFCILIGVIGFQFLQRNVFRGIGQILLSLGFVFLSMELISSGSAMIDPKGDLVEFIRLLEGHPIAVVLASTVTALLLQSSTATIALAIGLAASAHVGMTLLVPWVLGTNLGIALTASIAGWGSLEGRRLAVANLLVKGLATGLALALLPWLLHALAMAGAAGGELPHALQSGRRPAHVALCGPALSARREDDRRAHGACHQRPAAADFPRSDHRGHAGLRPRAGHPRAALDGR